MWDYSLPETPSFFEIIAKVLNGPISGEESETIQNILKSFPGIWKDCGINPENIPILVQNCHNVALCFLINAHSGPKKLEYI